MSSVNLLQSRLASNGSESTVLRLVRDYAPVSRTRVAALSGMTLQAVSRTVSPLIRNGLLTEERNADSTGPRRKRGLQLSRNAGCCLSVAFTTAGFFGCIVDTSYNVIVKDSLQCALAHASTSDILDGLFAFIERLRAQIPATQGKCLGLAIADPGVIDTETGSGLLSTTIDNWQGVPLKQLVSEKLDIPVMVVGGAVTGIRAVDRLELVDRNTDHLIYITYEAGIGCSMKLQGRYITGNNGQAGEFGHTAITPDPIPCRCGSTGCLEAVAAYPALVRGVREAISQGSCSVLTDSDELTGPQVLEAAGQNDRLAKRVVIDAMQHLGRAVGGLINLLSPEIVLFANVLGTAGDDCVSALMQSVRQSILPSHIDNVEVRISTLKSHIVCQGAAANLLDDCLMA